MRSSFVRPPFTRRFCFIVLFLFCLTWLATSDAVSCDSCGRECASACGTKHFRTCCFNYLRKRSSVPPLSPNNNNNNNNNNNAENDILTSPYNNDVATIPAVGTDLSPIEQNLGNWLRNTIDIENLLRRAIERMQQYNTVINKKKKLNDDNYSDLLTLKKK